MEKTKYLGIINGENLNWDEQFKRVRSKINTGLMSLKRLNTFCGTESSAVLIMVLLKVICDMVMLFGVA